MKRGAVRSADSIFVGAWIPIPLVNALDEAVQTKDSDRSKLLREALAEKVAKAKEVAA